jgi:hypothetical protein
MIKEMFTETGGDQRRTGSDDQQPPPRPRQLPT